MHSPWHQRIIRPQPLAASRAPNRDRAFTLIELMVVVAIIILLVGLTVSVTVILNQKSEVRKTERAMELLTMALKEWETAAEKTITYGTNGTPSAAVYTIQEITDFDEFHELTHKVVGIITKNAQAKQLLSNIDPKLLHQHDDELSVFDAWENDVLVIFPGRKHTAGAPGPDPDGTVRTRWENQFGVCVNGRMRFVSMGPDGLPGDLENPTDDNNDGQPDHIDNIHSYPTTS
jgi:prepilin-type N-terminal cleavage/methylation domain-containing protein